MSVDLLVMIRNLGPKKASISSTGIALEPGRTLARSGVSSNNVKFSNFFNDIENRDFQFTKRNIVRANPLASIVENISG